MSHSHPVDGPADPAVNGEPQTPEQIEAEIEAQRLRLAHTVDQLSAKLDVKAHAQARAEGVKQHTRETVATARHAATTDDGRPRPEVLAAAGSLVAIGLVLLIWSRRR
jgi:Protein of unknown function (DUF3618)